MPNLDWSQCPAVESIPGKVSGAWVFKNTRLPISALFQNLAGGATIDEVSEWFRIDREPLIEVLEFLTENLEAHPRSMNTITPLVNAHTF
jgi:uncharacterized protein (DUF433 family)